MPEEPAPPGLIIPVDTGSAVTPAEARALAVLAEGKRVIELGAWLGHSTIVLASVAEEVVSVDWHLGDEHAGIRNTWEEFLANLDRYGVAGNVIPVRGRFEDELPLMAELHAGEFDGAFIDAKHDLESVTRDTALVLPLIRPGGFIAWHDYGRGPHTGNPDFAITQVADAFGVAGVVGHLAWGFKPPPEGTG
jgi:predicted O-methyltransferase YrrM